MTNTNTKGNGQNDTESSVWQLITGYLPYELNPALDDTSFTNTKRDDESVINIKLTRNISVELISQLDAPYQILSIKIEKYGEEALEPDNLRYSFSIVSDYDSAKIVLTTCDAGSSHHGEYSMTSRHRHLPRQTFNMDLLDYAYPTSEGPTLLSSTELYGVRRAISHCHCSYGVRYFERENIHPRKYALDKNGMKSGMNRIIYLTNNKAKSEFYGSINCPDTAQSLYAVLIGLGYSNDNIMPFLSFLNDHLAYPKLMEKLWNRNGKNDRTLWTNIQSIVASKQAEQGIHFSPVPSQPK